MNGLATYASVQEQEFDSEALVIKHAPLVKRIAYHLMNRLPPNVQADDLIQAGMIGLLEASRNYDPSQGASFETYSGIRIRGAMLDEIRRSDWTPRSVHRKARLVANAMREIENEQGRDARDVEVAEVLGMSLPEYHKILKDASGCRILVWKIFKRWESCLRSARTALSADRLTECSGMHSSALWRTPSRVCRNGKGW